MSSINGPSLSFSMAPRNVDITPAFSATGTVIGGGINVTLLPGTYVLLLSQIDTINPTPLVVTNSDGSKATFTKHGIYNLAVLRSGAGYGASATITLAPGAGGAGIDQVQLGSVNQTDRRMS
jgi:hypothetical protein